MFGRTASGNLLDRLSDWRILVRIKPHGHETLDCDALPVVNISVDRLFDFSRVNDPTLFNKPCSCVRIQLAKASSKGVSCPSYAGFAQASESLPVHCSAPYSPPPKPFVGQISLHLLHVQRPILVFPTPLTVDRYFFGSNRSDGYCSPC